MFSWFKEGNNTHVAIYASTLKRLNDSPTKEEIRKALSHIKNNKSPGNDSITGEMLKAGSEETVEMLHNLLNRVWQEKKIPQEWKEAVIIPIHKKGSKSQCQNYRGISLLSVPSKVLTRIIYERLYPTIDALLKDT